jgi:hypothetical protein
MLRVRGSAIQTSIYAQKMEQQKILSTHRHWNIRRICRALLGTISTACAPSSTDWDGRYVTRAWHKIMCRQIQMADSDVEMCSAADIGNRRLPMDQELATATRGRVQLV